MNGWVGIGVGWIEVSSGYEGGCEWMSGGGEIEDMNGWVGIGI